MDELKEKHFKRKKYDYGSIYDLPNEIILKSLFPLLSDIDIHNLGEACQARIKILADNQIPLGSRYVKSILEKYIDLKINNR